MNKEARLPKIRFLALTFLAVLLLHLILDWHFGFGLPARLDLYIADKIGGVLPVIFPVALVTVPWTLAQKKQPKAPMATLFVAAIAAAVLEIFFIQGRAFTAGLERSFHPQGCQLAIEFPSAPEITTIKLSQPPGDYAQASLKGDREYLRVECFPQAVSDLDAMKALSLQADVDSLDRIIFSPISSTLPASVLEMRGYKDVAGEETVFVIRYYRASQSTLLVVVASRSSDYPTEKIKAFFASVHSSRSS
jgi:hypothetical protein